MRPARTGKREKRNWKKESTTIKKKPTENVDKGKPQKDQQESAYNHYQSNYRIREDL